ncbi:hypothetical protein IP78_08715 [Brevundimonas sp. AAP58]|nr:hypothetical protein IP78_08715 [Brevundimonas sp. AAP58]
MLLGSEDLSGPRLQTGDLLLEPELLSLQLPDLQLIHGRPTELALNGLIQFAVTVSQFADTSFYGHGLRLHV